MEVETKEVQLIQGDCLEVLLTLPDNSVDALVTDPPSGIGFMGQDWDKSKGGFGPWVEWMSEVMRQCLRVMKPGAHGLVWALPRTSHWTGMALELAGFEVKDVVDHIFGSGMPKGGYIDKAIDSHFGAERDVVGFQDSRSRYDGASRGESNKFGEACLGKPGEKSGTSKATPVTNPATDQAKQWEGWAYNLKPSKEYWWLVQKPISESSVVRNVLEHGTGALNIGACKIGHDEECKVMKPQSAESLNNPKLKQAGRRKDTLELKPDGRWPSHTILSHSPGCQNLGQRQVKNTSGSINGHQRSEKTSHTYGEFKERRHFQKHGDADGMETVDHWRCVPGCPVLLMGEQSGVSVSTGGTGEVNSMFFGKMKPAGFANAGGLGDKGTAARYFKQLEYEPFYYTAKPAPGEKSRKGIDEVNSHPTVKPVGLMQEFVRLITPPGGLVLDPFNGSGTTGVAAVTEGFRYIGIDRDPEYIELTEGRLRWRQLSLL